MKNKIAQFNVRLPRETVQAMKVVTTMLDVPVQQLGADAIALYYGQADDEVMERRRLAVEAAKRIFPDGGRWCAMEGSNLRPPPCQTVEVAENQGQMALETADSIRYALHALPDVLSFSGGLAGPLESLPVAA